MELPATPLRRNPAELQLDLDAVRARRASTGSWKVGAALGLSGSDERAVNEEHRVLPAWGSQEGLLE